MRGKDGSWLYAAPCGNRAKWPWKRRTPVYMAFYLKVNQNWESIKYFVEAERSWTLSAPGRWKLILLGLSRGDSSWWEWWVAVGNCMKRSKKKGNLCLYMSFDHFRLIKLLVWIEWNAWALYALNHNDVVWPFHLIEMSSIAWIQC